MDILIRKKMNTFISSKIPTTISPEAQKVLQKLIEEFDPDLTYPGPADFAEWEKLQFGAEIAKAAINEKCANDFKVKVLEKETADLQYLEIYPKNYHENEKAIIYLHGGGYVVYSAKSSLTGCVPLADKSGKKVIVLDYPLAPKATFKVILQNFSNLYAHLLQEGYDSKNIAIYGDSSGGGLAAGGLLKLKNEGYPMPASLVLWSPWSDLSGIGDTYISLAHHDPKLHMNRLYPCALAYAPIEEHQNPYISPVYGEYDASFPPTLIQVGTREIFMSDAVRLFQKMNEEEVEVSLDAYEGMWHVWQKEFETPEAQKAISKTSNFIENHWR